MSELKPGHQVILEHAIKAAEALTTLEAIIAQGGAVVGGQRLGAESFQAAWGHQNGAFAEFLRALEEVTIPSEDLDRYISQLETLTHRHAQLRETIRVLKERSSSVAA